MSRKNFHDCVRRGRWILRASWQVLALILLTLFRSQCVSDPLLSEHISTKPFACALKTCLVWSLPAFWFLAAMCSETSRQCLVSLDPLAHQRGWVSSVCLYLGLFPASCLIGDSHPSVLSACWCTCWSLILCCFALNSPSNFMPVWQVDDHLSHTTDYNHSFVHSCVLAPSQVPNKKRGVSNLCWVKEWIKEWMNERAIFLLSTVLIGLEFPWSLTAKLLTHQ